MSTPYLVRRDTLAQLDAAPRSISRNQVGVAVEREKDHAEVLIRASAMHLAFDWPRDAGMLGLADPPSAPVPVEDGRLRVRTIPHRLTYAGIWLTVAGLLGTAVGGIMWAAHPRDDCADSRGFCIDVVPAVAQALFYSGVAFDVLGFSLWIAGARTYPEELSPQRAALLVGSR
jgi:hypothetical protein